MTLKDRIRMHYKPGIQYHDLMCAVFPKNQYPKAMNYSANGGPHGCAMALGKALRELGLYRDSKNNTVEGRNHD